MDIAGRLLGYAETRNRLALMWLPARQSKIAREAGSEAKTIVRYRLRRSACQERTLDRRDFLLKVTLAPHRIAVANT